jgi:hypothetical protein
MLGAQTNGASSDAPPNQSLVSQMNCIAFNFLQK